MTDASIFDIDQAYFSRYLGTVNRAIQEAQRRFTSWPGLSALRRELSGRAFVVVLKGHGGKHETRLGCTLSGLEFRSLLHPPREPAVTWRIRREHVWDVLERPWRYIADPSRLELPPFTLLAPYPTTIGRDNLAVLRKRRAALTRTDLKTAGRSETSRR